EAAGRTHLLVTDRGPRRGERLEAAEGVRQRTAVDPRAGRRGPRGQARAPGELSEPDLRALGVPGLGGIEALEGGPVLEHAVLVDARGVAEGVAPHHGLV